MKKLVLFVVCAAALLAGPVHSSPALTITGADQTLVLDRAQLETLPQTTIVTHSPYFKGAAEFTGPSLKRLLAGEITNGYSQFTLHALNDYRVNGDLEELLAMDPIIATRMDGKAMSVRDRGPYWLMLPLTNRPELDRQEYHRFMVWQLEAISLD